MGTLPTVHRHSAGGVAFRRADQGIEIVLIAVGEPRRWQLPKGQIEPGEGADRAAVREVLEETGIEAEILGPLDAIEYWFVGTEDGHRVRVHKTVRWFLMRCTGGDTSRHDDEVAEARWVGLDEAEAMLAFENERRIVAQAGSSITDRS